MQDSTLTGTYSVNTDCTATIWLSDASGAVAQFSGVIVGQGDTVLVAQTDAPGISGRMKHVRRFCQTGDLMGSFGIQYSGSVLGSSGGASSSTGTVVLDGNGGAFATESHFNAGKSVQTASSGSMSVNPDCSLTMSLMAADGSSVNFAGLITVDSRGATEPFLVRSDAGTAVSGAMMAQ